MHYNEKENIVESWEKMSDTEVQLGHSNIANVALKRIRKYSGKKNKRHYRRRKRKTQNIF